MISINTELDLGEAEALFTLIHKEIVHHKIEKKLQFLAKEIDEPTFQWHQNYATFVEGIFKKVTGKEWTI